MRLASQFFYPKSQYFPWIPKFYQAVFYSKSHTKKRHPFEKINVKIRWEWWTPLPGFMKCPSLWTPADRFCRTVSGCWTCWNDMRMSVCICHWAKLSKNGLSTEIKTLSCHVGQVPGLVNKAKKEKRQSSSHPFVKNNSTKATTASKGHSNVRLVFVLRNRFIGFHCHCPAHCRKTSMLQVSDWYRPLLMLRKLQWQHSRRLAVSDPLSTICSIFWQ